jgi:hypothetical protein
MTLMTNCHIYWFYAYASNSYADGTQIVIKQRWMCPWPCQIFFYDDYVDASDRLMTLLATSWYLHSKHKLQKYLGTRLFRKLPDDPGA